MRKLSTDPELQGLLGAVSGFSQTDLERQLCENGGPMDPIIVWQGHDQIIDGHRRYKICQKHNLPFETEEIDLPDKKAVMVWMLHNQLARRNVPPAAEAKFLAKLADLGGTQRETAQVAGVCTRTVNRAQHKARIYEELDKDIRDRVEPLSASVDTLRDFSTLPAEHQGNVLDEVESGEFKNLASAMGGNEPEPPPKASINNFHQVTLRVADLKKTIDALNVVSPSHRHPMAIKAAGQVMDIVRTWESEA